MIRQGTFDPHKKQEADEIINVNDDLNESVTDIHDLYEEEQEEDPAEDDSTEDEFADDLNSDDK
jgi:hypothetical protein